ncbi:hypothetical protein AXG93_3698s1020 [Marchantia polymorpha subsp. ruderalis]|uniref:Uncharacterized protein n=1 Tax=Marchantia polymorpha subsp. ruderalis TaxID=1480154 RepID=A0A176VXI0_MARPO|nr:hypothetical protein AXG93_3698s1020 [Marchantia polymorpha subsp. ruderalis]
MQATSVAELAEWSGVEWKWSGVEVERASNDDVATAVSLSTTPSYHHATPSNPSQSSLLGQAPVIDCNRAVITVPR